MSGFRIPTAAALTALLAINAPAHAQKTEPAVCPQLQFGEAPPPSSGGNLVVTADQATLDRQGVSHLSGSVRLNKDGRMFSAPMLDYNDQTKHVQTKEPSLFQSPSLVVKSQSADFDMNENTGAFLGTEFTLPERAAHGTADRLALTGPGTAEADHASYTTCAPGSRDWLMTAKRINLDRDAGVGSARNAILRLHDVPVLYLPYVRFPINSERRTGFLAPTVGESSKTGFETRWPFYLNLAPNYDMQLTPRYMTKRGLQVGSEFRYLLPDTTGRLGYEYLKDQQLDGRVRSFLDYEDKTLLSSRMSLDAQYKETSDDTYFQDLGGDLKSSAATDLERHARVVYERPAAYTVQAQVQDFQIIDPTIARADQPYKRLPQLLVNALTPWQLAGARAGLDGELVNFVKPAAVEGVRLDMTPFLRVLNDHGAWYYTGEADLRYTRYQLTDTPAGEPQNLDRTLPILSSEGGLRFERFTTSGMLQTLEPRAYYLYVPFRNQDQIPIFDTGEPDFDFHQLFVTNRFSGADRISDANQIAASLTSRLLDPQTGVQRLEAAIGQIYRFENSRVSLPGGASPPDSGSSDIIGALDYALSRRISAILATQFSTDRGDFARNSVVLRYRGDESRADFGYRFRRGLLEQTDVSFAFPVTPAWSTLARWRYSFRDNKIQETVLGLEYGTCCLAVRVAARRFIATTSGRFNTGVFMQLELKGLTQIGGGFKNLLPPLE